MIRFFKEDIRFRLMNQKELSKWITSAAVFHKYKIEEINYIFCSDKYLLALNKKFLHHNFYTDIITFDNSTEKKIITGDIFISYDSVQANAKKFNSSFKDELHRVMIHGVLHLVGYKDKTSKDRESMRNEEDAWLAKRKF